MARKKILIAVDEFKTLRLRCNHCQVSAVFGLDTADTISEARCSSCGTLIVGAHHLVNKYREFFADLKHFAKARGATFEVAWRD